MKSLRARLFAALALALLVVLGGGGVLLYGVMSRWMRSEVDARLDARLLPAVEAFEESHDGRPKDDLDGGTTDHLEQKAFKELDDENAGICFAVFAADGRVLARSGSRRAAVLSMPAAFHGDRVLYDVLLAGGDPGRAIAIHAPAAPKEGRVEDPQAATAGSRIFVLALSTAALEARLARLATLLLLAVAATWLVAAAVCHVVLARGLAPFARFADRVAKADVDSAATPTGNDLPSELAPIARKLDTLIGRLRGAVARERRFNSAVAHELRTPVAELRATTDVAHGSSDLSSLRGALTDIEGSVRHLESILRALLSLRQGEHLREETAAEPIALEEFIAAAAARVAATAARRNIDLQRNVNAAEPFLGDPGRLRSIVDNVVANAVDYAPPGSRVAIDASVAADALAVRVRNLRPEGLSRGDLERFFEPFWRASSRNEGDGHAGLGLFVARAFAGSIGGRVEARLVGDEVEVELKIPREAAVAVNSR